MSWYDNEWGYSNRVVDLAERLADVLEKRAKTPDVRRPFNQQRETVERKSLGWKGLVTNASAPPSLALRRDSSSAWAVRTTPGCSHRLVATDAVQHFPSVHPGKSDVQDDQIR